MAKLAPNTAVHAALDERQIAVKIGHDLPENAQAFIASLADKKEDIYIGPTKLFLMLDQADFDWEKVPVPGSKADPKNPGNGYYETFISNGEEMNWFTVASREFGISRKIEAGIADISLRLKGDVTTDGPYKNWAGQDLRLKAERSMLQARLSAFRSLFRNACKIAKQMEALSEHEELNIQYDTETVNGNVELRRTKTPFILQDKRNTINMKFLTAGDFLRMDVAKAVEISSQSESSLYEALLATMKKKQREGKEGQGGEALTPRLKSTDMAASSILSFNDYFYNSDEAKKNVASYRTKALKDETVLLALGDMHDIIDSVFTPDLREKYDDLIAGQKKASQAA